MLGFFKDLFSDEKKFESNMELEQYISDNKKVEIATCALFLEIANSDDEFSAEEKKIVFATMKKTFNLSDDYVTELIKLSEEQVKKSISLYEFTEIINSRFSENQKYEVLKNLWRLIFVDKNLDAFEEYFIRKISNNLHLSHKDLMAAKMEVKRELNI